MQRCLRVSVNRIFLAVAAVALILCVCAPHRATAASAPKFDALVFIEKNTTFFGDFGAFRKQWFAVEDLISGIKDEYQPFDWEETRNRAKDVVARHERLTVKFARDCRAARAKLSPQEAARAQPATELMLEYLDSVGLVVLRLYEMTEKLYRKSLDPYSYAMDAYNEDFRKFKALNAAFEKKGKEVNVLLYGESSPGGR